MEDDFAAQEPDEGYSEDPLNPTTSRTAGYLAKPRNDAVSALAASKTTADFPDWLTRHIAGLSVHDKTSE
jgi:F-box and WD-40 domain protein 1/11